MAFSQIATSVTIISSGLKSYNAISLTEFDTSALSAIASGSAMEVANAFFLCDGDESVTGFSSITTGNTCYLTVEPAGTAGSQILNAAWTETAPVWDDSKQGWYASAASSIRTIATGVKTGSASCERKRIMSDKQSLLPRLLSQTFDMGDWNMDADVELEITAATHAIPPGNIRSVEAWVRPDTPGSGGFNYLDDLASDGLIAVEVNGDVSLTRTGAGKFDSVNYDSTSFNRGWVIIHYAEE